MNKVIAAVHGDIDFESALNSCVETIFDLSPNIMTVEEKVKKAHSKGKKVFVHIDLAEGIGKDRFGILHVKQLGVDGVISTRTGLIKAAKELGVCTVQRFFMVDSQSVETTLKTLNISKPDMIELMPGTVGKVISKLKTQMNLPIIAGGLIETQEEANEAYSSGAIAISTGKRELW
jgi:glycerol uptake operon antiterminator